MTPEQEAFVKRIPELRELYAGNTHNPGVLRLLDALSVIESQQLDWGLLFDDYGQLALDVEKLREELANHAKYREIVQQEFCDYERQLTTLRRAVVELADAWTTNEFNRTCPALVQNAATIATCREALK